MNYLIGGILGFFIVVGYSLHSNNKEKTAAEFNPGDVACLSGIGTRVQVMYVRASIYSIVFSTGRELYIPHDQITRCEEQR